MSFMSFIGNIGGAYLGYRGARRGQDMSAANAAADRAFSRELAQHGISWKVADAKRAGIHPLYAIGAPPMSAPSTSVFPGDFSGVASSLSAAGQSLDRALMANRGKNDRTQVMLGHLAVERSQLENDFLRARIAKLNSPGTPPPVPEMGTAPAPIPVETVPLSATAAHPKAVHQEHGAVTDLGFVRVPGGGYAPVPSKDAKERLEDMGIPQVMWSLRNNFLPNVGLGTPPPKSWLPKGAHSWRWSHSKQAWVPDRDYKGRTVPLPKGYR